MIFKGQKKERKIKTQENIQQKNKITGWEKNKRKIAVLSKEFNIEKILLFFIKSFFFFKFSFEIRKKECTKRFPSFKKQKLQ